MTDTAPEPFDDDEAALFLEWEERLAAIHKANRVADPDVRDAAVAHLFEEAIQHVAKLADEMLTDADDGNTELTEEDRQALLEGIALAVDRPSWYVPGERIVLPVEDDDGGTA